MKTLGTFYGIGVGPGEPGLLSVIAWETLQQCDLIFVPRAKTLDYSAARRALPPHKIPEERFRTLEFQMESDRDVLRYHYTELAQTLAAELESGKQIAYLTLGDTLTYSTYIYTLHALLECLPKLTYRTFPGITSYCALAAATNWPLGEGKETVLILPCPDEMEELRAAIVQHDVVVLMKIGGRFPDVWQLLQKMEITAHCVYGHRVGMPEERLAAPVSLLNSTAQNGYLATLLIRKTPRQARHLSLKSQTRNEIIL